MPAPETQITLRITPEDLSLFDRILAHLTENAIVAPRESDLHRKIYNTGLRVIHERILAAGETRQNATPAPSGPPDTDESL